MGWQLRYKNLKQDLLLGMGSDPSPKGQVVVFQRIREGPTLWEVLQEVKSKQLMITAQAPSED